MDKVVCMIKLPYRFTFTDCRRRPVIRKCVIDKVGAIRSSSASYYGRSCCTHDGVARRHRRSFVSELAGGPMKRQVARSSSRPPPRGGGRDSRRVVCLSVPGSPTENSAMRITVVDIDLTHGRRCRLIYGQFIY